MSKSLNDAFNKIQNNIQAQRNIENERNRILLERSEQQRREWNERNRIYSASQGGTLNISYKTIIDTIWLYPIDNINPIIEQYKGLSPSIIVDNNKLSFGDISSLYSFYDAVYTDTTISQPIGNVGYSLGVGTILLDLNQTLFLNLDDGKTIIKWQLVKQLTSQSDLPAGGNSPDNTIGYIVSYCDWDEDGEQDPLNLMPSSLGYSNGDPLRIEKRFN